MKKELIWMNFEIGSSSALQLKYRTFSTKLFIELAKKWIFMNATKLYESSPLSKLPMNSVNSL